MQIGCITADTAYTWTLRQTDIIDRQTDRQISRESDKQKDLTPRQKAKEALKETTGLYDDKEKNF